MDSEYFQYKKYASIARKLLKQENKVYHVIARGYQAAAIGSKTMEAATDAVVNSYRKTADFLSEHTVVRRLLIAGVIVACFAVTAPYAHDDLYGDNPPTTSDNSFTEDDYNEQYSDGNKSIS